MSLWVEVYVGSKCNRKLVASSVAHNVSNLADTSDYIFTNTEFGAEHLGIPPQSRRVQSKDTTGCPLSGHLYIR